tara:strand:- start:324 stop:773 length:450 start_codon:yes stop_codon:yes gene_type:complete
MSLEQTQIEIAKQLKESIQDSLLTATKKGSPPIVSGKLLNSIEVVPNDNNGFDILMEEYGLVVDQGRRKGAKQPPYAPLNVILDWLKARRIKPRNGITMNQLAFVVSRGISKGSYTPRPFIERGINQVADKMLDEIAFSFEEQIDKAFK